MRYLHCGSGMSAMLEVFFVFTVNVHYCLYGVVFVHLAKSCINSRGMQDMEAGQR